jgi:hypothetical protein
MHVTDLRSIRLAVAITAGFLLALPPACSSSSSSESSPQDGGEDGASDGSVDAVADASMGEAAAADGAVDAVADARAGDAAGDAGVDAPSDGGGPTLVQAGQGLIVEGVTADGHVVYFDETQQTYFAKTVAGGAAPTALYAVSPELTATYVQVQGNQVFIYGASSNYVSTLLTWAPGMPAPITLSNTGLLSYDITAWLSDDGKHIAFLQVDAANPSVGAIYGANADGSNPALLVSGIVTSFNAVTFPHVALRGGYAVVSSCATTDAGTLESIDTFSIADDWAAALSIPNVVNSVNSASYSAFTVDSFAIDPDAGQIVAASASTAGGALQVFPIGGADAGTVIDPAAPLTPSLSFLGTPTVPWQVLYNTAQGQLRVSPVAPPAPQVLVDGGVNAFASISRDGKWILVASQLGSDLSLASTQTPGAPQLVAASSQSQYHGLPLTVLSLPNDGFTEDGKYVVFVSDLVQQGSDEVFYVHAAPTATPGAAQLLSTGYAVAEFSLPGSKVLLFDDYQVPDGGAAPTVDLAVVDPSTTAPRVVIAAGVPLPLRVLELQPGGVALSPDRTEIFYPVTSGPTPGIYASPIP